MKKNYFLLAATTMMFAACAQTDLVNEVVTEETPQAIGFETFAEKTTRHSSSTTMTDYQTTFGVFGYNNNDGLFMKNFKVHDENKDAKWIYIGETGGADGSTVQEAKYWNKLATYDFYAYAPYNSGVNFDGTKFTIPSGNYAATENLQTTFGTRNGETFSTNVDWMLASQKNYTYSQGATVPLAFSHMLSKIAVVVKTTGDEDITVTNISLEGDTYKTGYYNGTAWEPSNEVVLTGVVGDIEEKNMDYYSMEYLLIPAATAAPKLSIDYTVNGQTYRQSDLAISGITSFAPNTFYTITVTIGLEPIQFSATSATWGAGTGSVTIE